jgi:site-specific DNA-methyltransferase (adenine-specific)
MDTNVIYNEDCLGKNGMCRLPDNSIDMILADLPYGTTACKWDIIIPLKPLWKQYKRVIKEDGAIVLTASQPFTTKIISSNMEWFRYEWIYQKRVASNFVLAKKRPLKEHENILVFYNKQPKYNPIKEERKGSGLERLQNSYHTNSNKGGEVVENIKRNNANQEYTDKKYPSSIQEFNNRAKGARGLHPTQKPVALFEYLIKTYTNENEIVLDNVIGSGTTAVACLKTNRKFIGFEKEEEYYNIALKRIGKLDKKYYEQLPEEEKPKQTQLF